MERGGKFPAVARTARDREEQSMRERATVVRSAVGLGVVALIACGLGWEPRDAAAAAPSCASLATNPQFGLKNNPVIKSVTSAITATAAPASVPYCRVTLVYGTTSTENITIAVGLPLSAADGGSGGIRGAWNGRTQ